MAYPPSGPNPLFSALGVGRPPPEFQRPVNPILKEHNDRIAAEKARRQAEKDAAGRPGLPPGFAYDENGNVVLEQKKRPTVISTPGGGADREIIDGGGSALELGQARDTALRSLLLYGDLSPQEAALSGEIEPHSRFGSKSNILTRFGVSPGMDFDETANAVWDYVRSGKEMTQSDLAGLRDYLVRKRQATSDEESPWWRMDPYEDRNLEPGISDSAYGVMLPTPDERKQIARERLLQHIIGGWNAERGPLGGAAGIGDSRTLGEWARDPEDVRDRLGILQRMPGEIRNMRDAMRLHPEDFPQDRFVPAGPDAVDEFTGIRREGWQPWMSRDRHYRGGHIKGPAQRMALEKMEELRRTPPWERPEEQWRNWPSG